MKTSRSMSIALFRGVVRATRITTDRKRSRVSSIRFQQAHHRAGFSMIEIIAVLLMAAVLGGIAIRHISDTKRVALVAEAERIRGHLRFCRSLAMSDNTHDWQMFVRKTFYTLKEDSKHSAQINLPGETTSLRTIPRPMQFPRFYQIKFDEYGSPGNADISMPLIWWPYVERITIRAHTGVIE